MSEMTNAMDLVSAALGGQVIAYHSDGQSWVCRTVDVNTIRAHFDQFHGIFNVMPPETLLNWHAYAHAHPETFGQRGVWHVHKEAT